MGLTDILALLGSGILIVLLLVATYYASRWYAKRIGRVSGGHYIKVVDQAGLAPGSSLMIVEIQGSYYLLGISDKNMQLITRLEDFTPDAPTGPQGAFPYGESFRELLSKAGFTGKGRNSKDNGDS